MLGNKEAGIKDVNKLFWVTNSRMSTKSTRVRPFASLWVNCDVKWWTMIRKMNEGSQAKP